MVEFIGVRRNLTYSEAPPTRLLSMTLNLCYFIGFLDGVEVLEPGRGLKRRIIRAKKHILNQSLRANARTAMT